MEKQENVEAARHAVARHRNRRQAKQWVGILAVFAAAYFIVNQIGEDPPDRNTDPGPCTEDTAECVSQRFSAAAQGPCSQAVETMLQHPPEWTDGLLESRFTTTDWYQPGQSIILHGDQLLATNSFGGTQRMNYFCVISATNGVVISAGIPSLDARVGADRPKDSTLPAPRSKPATAPTPTPNLRRRSGNRFAMYVTRDTFDGLWPLVPDRATVLCERSTIDPRYELASVIIGDREYALNGTARMQRGYAELDAMWLDNEDIPGAKVSIGPLIAATRAICSPRG